MSIPRLAAFTLLSLAASAMPLSAAVTSAPYGRLADGRAVTQYTLANAHGLRATLLDYGATLASFEAPDRYGRLADITLGYGSLPGWLANTSYFGGTIGRFANRIAHGRFALGGKTYQIPLNNTPGGIPCSLHGGEIGFNKRLWAGRPVERPGASGVEFTYHSPDGEEGFPGDLTARVTYWLTDTDELEMDYAATTDRPTVVNLTNHTYWNLSGDPRNTILDEQLMLNADGFLPVDAGLIPTGRIESVAGLPFDFRREKPIADGIDDPGEQVKLAGGFDFCWVLNGPGAGVRLAARAYDPESGRQIELFTDAPGVQFYTGNFLDGTVVGKGGVAYQRRTAFCLEPEAFPDAPNQPAFPTAVLLPGQTYRRTILYKFSARPSGG